MCLSADEHFSLVLEHVKSLKRNKLTLLDPDETLARVSSTPTPPFPPGTTIQILYVFSDQFHAFYQEWLLVFRTHDNSSVNSIASNTNRKQKIENN